MIPLLLLAAAALADIYTTIRGIKSGAVETNPVIVKLFGKRPSLGALLAVKAATFAVIAYFGTPTTILIAAAIWAVVAVLNLRHV